MISSKAVKLTLEPLAPPGQRVVGRDGKARASSAFVCVCSPYCMYSFPSHSIPLPGCKERFCAARLCGKSGVVSLGPLVKAAEGWEGATPQRTSSLKWQHLYIKTPFPRPLIGRIKLRFCAVKLYCKSHLYRTRLLCTSSATSDKKQLGMGRHQGTSILHFLLCAALIYGISASYTTLGMLVKV